MSQFPVAQQKRAIGEWVHNHSNDLLSAALDLIRLPSENRPPAGGELPVQAYLHEAAASLGFESELYELSSVEALESHPLYWPGRDYADRPNLIAAKRGAGGGKSLMFSVHADVVPGIPGETLPFEPEIRGGRLYGRGSNDMKGGIAAVLTAFRYLQENHVALKGDLFFESVVDEEMGGANGTLAGRIRDFQADAVIIPEPTNLRVCSAHLGGVTWRIGIKGKGGMGFGGEELHNPAYGMAHIIREIEAFHEEYRGKIAFSTPSGHVTTPNVVLSYAKAGEFEPGMADGIPSSCLLEVWVESVPGETLADLENSFQERIRTLCSTHPALQAFEVTWEQITRFIPGSRAETELTPLLLSLVSERSGRPEESRMAPFGCDAFVFNLHSPSPAVILGPSGENAHAADEFVDIASLEQLTQVYIEAIMQWCGYLQE